MSRKVYTYTDLKNLPKNKYFKELAQYPIVTVSADLRKGFVGALGVERKDEVFKFEGEITAIEFRNITSSIDDVWSSDQQKFKESVILSEFLRNRILTASDEKEIIWLRGCLKNIDSIMSAINLLVEADIEPTQLDISNDRNLSLLIDAWNYLMERDDSISAYKAKLEKLTSKELWEDVFAEAFSKPNISKAQAIVFLGFYFITPIQERIMSLLEKSGFQLIFLIPYDERFPFAYEVWDRTYSESNGYDSKEKWIMEKTDEYDPYGLIFEGEEHVSISNKLDIKEYCSVIDFVDDVKHIKDDGFTLYAACHRDANEMLKDFFPEEYGDRKILSYPIGQFLNALNKMWDEDLETIVLDEDDLIDCFSSGWLSIGDISGKQYMQDLMHMLPFFSKCTTIDKWEKQIEIIKSVKEDVVKPFIREKDVDPSISRWQSALENPFDNFSMFSVEDDKMDVILSLIKQLLEMARELFGDNRSIKVNEHLKKMNHILRRHDISKEIFEEERSIIDDIFQRLNQSDNYIAECAPSDIARALDLFICGRYDDNELDVNRVGFVRPIFFVEAEPIKNRSKAHVCMCDVSDMPGGNKEYIWPLTRETIMECCNKTGNKLINNLILVMDSTVLSNRYFMYSALKNDEVCLSWISEMNEKKMTPSPYIRLIADATGIKLNSANKKTVTFERVKSSPFGLGRTEEYFKKKQPLRTVKEAEMDYALCPMKYTLSYVLERFPTYESDFQQSYAINALISAIYNLMKNQNVTIDEIYKNVIELFPYLRKSEKRQVYDYISYDRGEDDFDYGVLTPVGSYYYTDERLKIHYPNQDVRQIAKSRFGKLYTPDGREGLDLYEEMRAEPEEMMSDLDPVRLACSFCPQINCCRNAVYSGNQENYYD